MISLIVNAFADGANYDSGWLMTGNGSNDDGSGDCDDNDDCRDDIPVPLCLFELCRGSSFQLCLFRNN